MSEEEKKDILFQIDMQLYDEFNDTIATMNDHLGDIYSLRDIEEVEKTEKYKEIKLLREAVENQQKELDKKDKMIKLLQEEREYIKNNLEVDLNRRGVYSQAKGQISQILEYYKSNDDYFTKKVEDIKE